MSDTYSEFRDDMEALSPGELAELDTRLKTDPGFRKEAGSEFAHAVSNARISWLFDRPKAVDHWSLAFTEHGHA